MWYRHPPVTSVNFSSELFFLELIILQRKIHGGLWRFIYLTQKKNVLASPTHSHVTQTYCYWVYRYNLWGINLAYTQQQKRRWALFLSFTFPTPPYIIFRFFSHASISIIPVAHSCARNVNDTINLIAVVFIINQTFNFCLFNNKKTEQATTQRNH